MTTTTTEDNTAGGSSPSFSMKFVKSLAEWRVYLGVAIFFVVLTLLLGIVCLSYLNPKKEPLMFGLIILSILLALGTFSALCFFVQRAKDQKYGDQPFDPNHVDVGCALGIAALFGFSALAELEELPKRCYSGLNEDFIVLGPHVCGVITTMGIFSCLGALTMLITCIIVAIAVRKAFEIAKLPPPISPSGAEPAAMRQWLDRDDPFANARRGTHSRENSYNV